MKKKRILFVAPHREGRAPSQRFRFEQYIVHLEKNGFETEFSNLISEEDDRIFYSPGHWMSKAFIFLKSIARRRNDVRGLHAFDIVFIQREAFMTGSVRFEKAFVRKGAKVVYDFDDSIWLMDVSAGNRWLKWLKDPGKTAKIIGMSHMVFAGNEYLANYARQFSSNVKIVPTTIDTDEYRRMPVQKESGKIVIGWSGSITTIKHFEFAIPFLRKLKKRYGGRIIIKVIGDGSYVNRELGIQGIQWKREDEVKELSAFDIGIMPLPDDEWAKGKCGLKGLQYMALGIPAIMSPVGVNREIIRDGENGFLAAGTDEWEKKLEMLIESEDLRSEIGEKGRITVEEKYSVNAWKDEYVRLLSEL